MSRAQCFVVGGGVVGLAVARALSRSFEVVLLESLPSIGSQTSSRNSEVIHSGIYYTPGSLKAQFTAPACDALYEYAESRNIEHKKCGKIIVATNEVEVAAIEQLYSNGTRNLVEGIKRLSASDMRSLEPNLRGHSGLLVPQTGIINSHQLMTSLQADAEADGAVVVTNCTVNGGCVSDTVGARGQRLLCLDTSQGRFESEVVVNCAGHLSPSIAARFDGHPISRVPRPYYCKGNYFKLAGVKSPFRRLVYPVPREHGLGVHATIDMMGVIKFGPDTEWIEPNCSIQGVMHGQRRDDLPDWVYSTFCDKDYVVHNTRSDSFYAEIRKYWPDLPDNSLVPDYSGCRPKIIGPGGVDGTPNSVPGRNLKDFVIEGYEQHGVKGLVNLYGIESPGLTACLKIAEYVQKIV